MDDHLTHRLQVAVLDLAADGDWDDISVDQVARRASAGRMSVRRRWASLDALMADALATCTLVWLPPDAGTLRGDLLDLLRRWDGPLSRDERAAAAVVGPSWHSDELRSALQSAVVDPLTVVVATICTRQDRRGPPIHPSSRRLLTTLVQALWWQRYIEADQVTAPEIVALVDTVLLPAATST